MGLRIPIPRGPIRDHRGAVSSTVPGLIRLTQCGPPLFISNPIIANPQQMVVPQRGPDLGQAQPRAGFRPDRWGKTNGLAALPCGGVCPGGYAGLVTVTTLPGILTNPATASVPPSIPTSTPSSVVLPPATSQPWGEGPPTPQYLLSTTPGGSTSPPAAAPAPPSSPS